MNRVLTEILANFEDRELGKDTSGPNMFETLAKLFGAELLDRRARGAPAGVPYPVVIENVGGVLGAGGSHAGAHSGVMFPPGPPTRGQAAALRRLTNLLYLACAQRTPLRARLEFECGAGKTMTILAGLAANLSFVRFVHHDSLTHYLVRLS